MATGLKGVGVARRRCAASRRSQADATSTSCLCPRSSPCSRGWTSRVTPRSPRSSARNASPWTRARRRGRSRGSRRSGSSFPRSGQGGGDPRPRARGSTARSWRCCRGSAWHDCPSWWSSARRTGSTTSPCRRSPSHAPRRQRAGRRARDRRQRRARRPLGEHGIATVHVAEHDAFSSYAPAAVARAALDVMGRPARRGRRRRERARQRGARPRRGDRRPAVRRELHRGDAGDPPGRRACAGAAACSRKRGCTGRPRS